MRSSTIHAGRASARQGECSPPEALAEDLTDAFDDRAGACLQLQEAPECETCGYGADATQHVCPSGADFLQFGIKLA